MLDGIWIRGDRLRQGSGGRLVQLRHHETEIRRHVVEPIRVGARGGDDVEVGGGAGLKFAEQVRVHAELQQRAGAGLARKFGVVRLVVPVAKVACARHLHEHVGKTKPPRVPTGGAERCLDDDVHAATHGLHRALHVAMALEVFDHKPPRAERVHIPRLVLHAALAQDVREGFVVVRTLAVTVDGLEFQRGFVPAREKVRQVGRGQNETVVVQLHGGTLSPAGR